MKVEKGGTDKWCPHCGNITVCRAENPSTHGKPSGQRWFRRGHEDIAWFRRGLTCTACGNRWLTAELPETYLDELVELRNSMAQLKKLAASFVADSTAASKSLKQLEAALSSLAALKTS